MVSTLGAFQASVSVLITLGYGLIAARMGMVRAGTARDVASLCRNVFLPALLITDIGSQLNRHNFLSYAPVFIWSITYTVVSIIMGRAAVKMFGLPGWVVAVVTFNNTTSLPLLLTRSLLETGILSGIAGDDVEGAVARARSYFLINSLVSKVLTFAIGPELLGEGVVHQAEVDSDDMEARKEPDEETTLLPKPITSHLVIIPTATTRIVHDTRQRSLWRALKRSGSFFNPTTWGGIIAIVVGIVPSLHRAAFAPSNEGGFLNAWLMSSLRNVGALFSGMEVFIVGSKLSDSFDVRPHEASPNPSKGTVAAVILIRFFVWATISIPLVYLIATKTRLLGDDPILWWSMMIMPIGPPGMILSILLEAVDAERRMKMMVARVLVYAYMATPLMALAVVGALNVTQAVQATKSAQL